MSRSLPRGESGSYLAFGQSKQPRTVISTWPRQVVSGKWLSFWWREVICEPRMHSPRNRHMAVGLSAARNDGFTDGPEDSGETFREPVAASFLLQWCAPPSATLDCTCKLSAPLKGLVRLLL